MPNDFELIQQAQLDHRMAFRDLVTRHQKTAYYFAYNLTGNHDDAADLSQDVFIQIYHSLDRFRGESKFETWLYRITINTWMNMKRRKNVKLHTLIESLDHEGITLMAADSSPEHDTEQSLLYERIQKAMNKLSPKEKFVFVLRQLEDQKLEVIANILNIKIGTVKSLLFRALKKMQKELAVYHHEMESEA